MNDIDNKAIAGISIIFVYAAFAVISLLVIVSNKHPFLVKYKLKTGAIIITLIGVMSCDPGRDGHITTCYIGPIEFEQSMGIDEELIELNETILINQEEPKILTGKINYRENNYFSFSMKQILNHLDKLDSLSSLDSIEMMEILEELEVSDTISYKGEILPADSTFDSEFEDFYLEVPAGVIPGYYYLYLYAGHKDDMENDLYYLNRYRIKVSE